jgi:hypothetical protein
MLSRSSQLGILAATRSQGDLSGQGGALKDWHQSQVDLANVRGGLSGTQIALAFVCR